MESCHPNACQYASWDGVCHAPSDIDCPIREEAPQGYLCEGGEQCPHGADGPHWVEAGDDEEPEADVCPACGGSGDPGSEESLQRGPCLVCQRGIF